MENIEKKLYLMEIIKKRGSVRRYLPAKIAREIINTLLEAARWAPSSQNTQSWRYIVIDDENILQKFREIAFSGLARPNRWIEKAPCIILACCDKRVFGAKKGEVGRKLLAKLAPDEFKYLEIDVAISMEHLVLQATELGLGTCWVGWFNKGRVRKFFKLPRGVEPLFLTPIGYQDFGSEELKYEKLVSKVSKSKTRKEMNEIAFFNRFGIE